MSEPAIYVSAILEALPRLSPAQTPQLASYLRLVDEYSHVLNLTRYRGARELTDEYVFAAAKVSEMAPLAEAGRGADLGSGAGCPVVTLAVLHPGWSFTAVESHQRRAAFLETVKAQVGLRNLTITNERTEQLIRRGVPGYDLVTARAYSKPAVLLQHAAALLRPGGELRAFISPDATGLDQLARSHTFSGLVESEVRRDGRQWRLLRAQRI